MITDGLPLFHGSQIAVDTTLVSPLRRTGPPTVVALGKTALCVKLAGGKSECIQSSPGHTEERYWLLPVKWKANDLRRRKTSSVSCMDLEVECDSGLLSRCLSCEVELTKGVMVQRPRLLM